MSQAELDQRARANCKHGGEGAIKAITSGEPLRGLAAEAEAAVESELATAGRYALVVRNATRLQAATDLFWHAIEAAAEQHDLEALDKYIKRFGWLAGSALRAWAQVKQEEPDNGSGALIVEAIRAAEEATDDDTD